GWAGMFYVVRMAKKKTSPRTPEVCPVCEEDVPHGALACPECGADHRSGWKEDLDNYDGAGVPEDDFNYEDFVAKEFGSGPKPAHISPIWWITAILLLAAMVTTYFLGR
ncbi:MAG TPA: hypothetical protein VF585_05505, partial [Chthoniobacterales bacterium]